jgi:hypothetical protein
MQIAVGFIDSDWHHYHELKGMYLLLVLISKYACNIKKFYGDGTTGTTVYTGS